MDERNEVVIKPDALRNHIHHIVIDWYHILRVGIMIFIYFITLITTWLYGGAEFIVGVQWSVGRRLRIGESNVKGWTKYGEKSPLKYFTIFTRSLTKKNLHCNRINRFTPVHFCFLLWLRLIIVMKRTHTQTQHNDEMQTRALIGSACRTEILSNSTLALHLRIE